MPYIQLIIQANEHQQEELIALLIDHNPEGFEQKENELIAWFDEKDFAPEDFKPILEDYQYQLQTVEARNWNKEWEKNFQPVVVDGFCAIRAAFHQPITNVQHEIIITPKMSFGTGHHATTNMMIQLMKDIDFAGKKVLDFGTGTGILAILAEKLGASSVTAIDVDEWSITNAEENCKANDSDKISLSLSSSIPAGQYDVILANINFNVLLQYKQQLIQALAPDGRLLLSGILTSDENDITAAFIKDGLAMHRKIEKENWIALLFKKVKQFN